MQVKQFNKEDIQNLNKIFKINLINSCTGYKSANLIGSQSLSGINNVAVFSSVVHLGSKPSLIGFISRPTTVIRHTLENIRATGVYTINHIYEDIIADAHHTSAKYPKEVSEYSKTNLIEEYRGDCIAPFVKDSPVQIEMKFLQELPIEINGTIMVIGEVENLYVKEELLSNDGLIDLTKGKVASINGLDTYTIPKDNTRFAYQKVKDSVE